VELAGKDAARTHCIDHIAQLADGGVSQYTFEIVGNHGHQGSQQGRNQAHQHHREGPARHLMEGRVEAGQQINASVDHCGRMDEGADGGGGFHGIGQPGLEGELGRFGRSRHQETESHHGQELRRNGRRVCQQDVIVHLPGVDVEHQGAQQQANAANLGHDEGFDAARHRLGIITVEGDEGVGTQGGNFPEDEHEQHVAGEYQANHGANEEEHVGVVAAELLFAVHVIDREDDRQAADEGGNHGQEDAQAIGNEADGAKNAAQVG